MCAFKKFNTKLFNRPEEDFDASNYNYLRFYLEIAHKATTPRVASTITATITSNNDAKKVEKFKTPLELKDWLIAEPMNTKLNKFKKSNPEAFFYWYKIYKLSIQTK